MKTVNENSDDEQPEIEEQFGPFRQVVKRGIPSPRSVNPKVPAELELVIQKMCEREPRRRYATAAEVRQRLAALAAESRQL